MTEVVQKRLELMTQELEEMRRTKLFTPHETRAVLKRRREFQYKINATTKDLKNFTNYICYEKCLLKDVQLRRDKYKIADKRASIEYNIIKRIKALYNVGLQRFSDIPLFMSFLKFCKKVNHINAASNAVSNMVKKHSDNEKIWHAAASWHAYDRMDTRTAVRMLLKGVAIHKDSRILYKEMIFIVLVEYERNVSLKENSPHHEAACVMKLEKIVLAILEKIKDIEFYLEILDLLDGHRFTVKVQDIIIECLMKDYSDNENVLHLLTHRERKGITDGCLEDTEGNESGESSLTKAGTLKASRRDC